MNNRDIAKKISEVYPLNWSELQSVLNKLFINRLEKNLINICFLSGLLQGDTDDEEILLEEFGLTMDAANWCSNFLYEFSKVMNSQERVNTVKENISLVGLEDGNILPKSIVIRVEDAEEELKIKDINCTVSFKESYDKEIGRINISGEIKHGYGKNRLLFLIAYNDKNEVIDWKAETKLSDKEGTEIFNSEMSFPIDEKLLGIYIRPALNPLGS
ncbi:hypothetical protein [Ligilactobacillus salivarius]|uniref:Uncharacterized protein n=1 Tax=Ligilactobacillus salivarius (strain UCC118) TaxID=362948 RepID=Q1WUK5_LIGS1|nr:hypothetical protein [Ligilactobacillus salivarius]ABD99330.1 Hypothetical protein LSL_0521 [Ligilactobacillus salivarius UCC118]ADJ78758.1 Putative uncharacterized protein [Ligilactobacillus salivarius CECT 5713]OQQ77275.1 hypothetical protein B6U64_03310 [Ligilactobacillus salivarius]OQR21191.1 hypothetical protein B6U40_02705 [Ligilactobacillus salivarius]